MRGDLLVIAPLVGLQVVLGTLTVATRDPRRQAFVAGAYAFVQAATLFALRAPDVALSQIVVGGVALPALTLLALGRIARHQAARAREDDALAAAPDPAERA